MNIKKPTLFNIKELQNSKKNRKEVLQDSGFKTIQAVKKEYGFSDAEQAYDYLFYNNKLQIQELNKEFLKKFKKDNEKYLKFKFDKEQTELKEKKQEKLLEKRKGYSNQIIKLDDLNFKIQKWNKLNNKKDKPFEITISSGKVDITKNFKFNSLAHFINWLAKMDQKGSNDDYKVNSGDIIHKKSSAFVIKLKKEIAIARASDNKKIEKELKKQLKQHLITVADQKAKQEAFNDKFFENIKSVFDTLIINNIKIIGGGCNKHTTTDKQLKTSFYEFELYNPCSRQDNCLFKCLAHITDEVIDIKKYRNLTALKGKIDIADAYKIIKAFTDKQIEIIDFTDIPELSTDIIYILLKDEHYYVIEKFTEILKKHISTKRGTIEFDIETRPTEKFHLIKASNTKSFILKDAITCAHIIKYKATESQKITFKTNEKTSTRQFIDWLNKETLNGRTYNILAHNGGNFDFYFIVNILTEQELRDTQIQMRGITIIGINYRGHLFKDSYCFLTFGLDSLSKNFKVTNGKITELIVNGEQITSTQLCFYKPDLTFEQFLELEFSDPDFWKQYIKYCMYDCIALHEIWTKFTKCVNDLISSINPYLLKSCPLMSTNTIGSHSKKLLNELNKESGNGDMFGKHKKMLDLFINGNKEKYQFLCKFKRGGISHCNKAGKHTTGITGVDIASQYPASLIYAKIPVGLSHWTEKYNPFFKGFYHLKNLVFSTEYTFKPIASIKDNGVLNWTNDNINEIYLDSYTIQYLKDNYGLLTFDVVSGLVSSQDITADKLFGLYVNTFYTEKKHQDELKKTDDPSYNPALRETIKLYLNSLTGKLVEDPSAHYSLKVIQGLLAADKYEGNSNNRVIQDDLDLQKMPKHQFNGIEVVKDICENEGKINDWIIAGIMVYSYSKRLLFEYIKCLPNNSNDVIHVETDSIYFSNKLQSQFLENVDNYVGSYPCKMGDDLGNLKIEKSTSEGQIAYFLGKKFYHITNESGSITKVKGIPQQTIDKYGNKIKLVDTILFESIYNGNEETRSFQTLKKNLFSEKSTISYHTMTRTIRGNQSYKLY